MKILKIDNKIGKYLFLNEEKNEYKDITQINLEDLKKLIEFILNNNVEKIKYDEKKLHNENSPNKVLFEELSKKLNEVIDSKENIIKRSW